MKTEINFVEDFFGQQINKVLKSLERRNIEYHTWLSFLENLKVFQASAPASLPQESCNGVILQSLPHCYEWDHGTLASMFHSLDLYKRYLFLPYKHLGILSPLDAARMLRIEKFRYPDSRPDPSFDHVGNLPTEYFRFLEFIKPFVENKIVTIIPPLGRDFRLIDGNWLSHPLMQKAEADLKDSGLINKYIAEMLVEYRLASQDNVDEFMHLGTPLLAQLYEDLSWSSRINGGYIAYNHHLIQILEIELEKFLNIIPRGWKKSPYFRTSISSKIQLPTLNQLGSNDILSLRLDKSLWDNWSDSMEKIFLTMKQLDHTEEDVFNSQVATCRMELNDSKNELEAKIKDSSIRGIAKKTSYDFSLTFVAMQITNPGDLSLMEPSVVSLLSALWQIFSRNNNEAVLLKHYSVLTESK